MHLVLATQRPSGAVSEQIRANIGLRIGLRLESDADSREVLEDPGAASLPRELPGRALLRFAGDRLVLVQTAMAGGRSPQAWPGATAPCQPWATSSPDGAGPAPAVGKPASALAGRSVGPTPTLFGPGSRFRPR